MQRLQIPARHTIVTWVYNSTVHVRCVRGVCIFNCSFAAKGHRFVDCVQAGIVFLLKLTQGWLTNYMSCCARAEELLRMLRGRRKPWFYP